MIPLAAIEGKLVFLVVAAVVGVINWLMEKSKKASEGGQAQPSPGPQTPATNPGGESEQERLRRFLEALGVPQPPQQPPPAQRQQPAAPPATRPSQQISQRVAQPLEGRMQSPRPNKKAPAKNVRPPKRIPFREPPEMTRAGRLEEAATSIENISGEFGAMNVRVAMEPVTIPETPAHMATGNAGTTSVQERDGSPIAARLRRLLHNPTDLRATFVAMEVLGTPRGLQS